jgi:hypothetical protein
MARSSSEPRGKEVLGCGSPGGGVTGRFTTPLKLSLPLRRNWAGRISLARAEGSGAAPLEKAVSEFAEIMRESIRKEGYHRVNIAYLTATSVRS